MRHAGKITFWFLLAVYALLFSLKKTGLYYPFFSDYLADLICLPIVLAISRFVIIKLTSVGSGFELSPAKIIVATCYIAIVFEFILPNHSPNYHSDMIDIVAYFLGASGYYFYRKKIKIASYAH